MRLFPRGYGDRLAIETSCNNLHIFSQKTRPHHSYHVRVALP